MSAPRPQATLYRVDRFSVPEAALPEFATLVERTHVILRGQSGFVRDLLLRQVSGPGRFNVTTIAEWADQRSYDAAVEEVRRFHDSIGFDRSSFAARLGIEADIGVYRNWEIA